MTDILPLGFGAHESPLTGNELVHSDIATAGIPPASFQVEYDFPHLTQNHIGICTAIDLADMLEKVWGVPFSPQFIYNVGKKMFDGNTTEGSSIITMLRVVNKYGAAPRSLVPTDDTTKPYADYVKDWFTPAAFAEALKYKMNYATARLDPLGFAADLLTSQYGLMTRMSVGTEWYTDKNRNGSYADNDIDPLRAPNPVTGGHSVKCIAYSGLDENQKRTLRNTWGDKDNPIMPGRYVWARNGDIDYFYKTLKPYVTEAWSIIKPIPNAPIAYIFTKDLTVGSTGQDVLHLQMYLNNHGSLVATTGPGSPGNETTTFGTLTRDALAKFQEAHGISPAVGFFGPITREFVNSQR